MIFQEISNAHEDVGGGGGVLHFNTENKEEGWEIWKN